MFKSPKKLLGKKHNNNNQPPSINTFQPPNGYNNSIQSGTMTPKRNSTSSSMAKVATPTSPNILNNPEHQRKLVTDKIILDCYSKTISHDGQKMHETSYIAHIGIIEYSNYPNQPPPPHLENVGSKKQRILVLCSKSSGRMQLQKGKKNDKNFYQIGRTWDLSELQCIRKINEDSMILELNKNYYWKCDEDDTRIWKFCRYLCQEYGSYMGKYPRLEGFTLDGFMLPETPKITNSPRSPRSPSSTSRSSSIKDKLKNKGKDLYKEMDFTSHGQLPVKPMKILSRDKETKLDSGFQERQNVFNQKPNYQQPAPPISKQPSQPSYQPLMQKQQSQYQAAAQSQPQVQKQPSISSQQPQYQAAAQSRPQVQKQPSISSQQAYQPQASLSKRSSLNQSTNSIQKSNTLHQSQSSLKSSSSSPQPQPIQTPSNTGSYSPHNHERRRSSDFKYSPHERKQSEPKINPSMNDSRQVSERSSHPYTTLYSKDNDSHSFVFNDTSQIDEKIEPKLDTVNETKPKGFEEFTNSLPERRKLAASAKSPDFGIEEITDESDNEQVLPKSNNNGLGISTSARSSQFIEESNKIEKNNEMQELEDMLDSHLNDDSFQFNKDEEKSFDEPVTVNEPEDVVPLHIVKKDEFERDAEIDEIFDDINWSIKTDSDLLLKNLTKEMNKVKQETVQQLVNVDLSNDKTNDIGSAIEEIENIKYIFQKMESSLKFILPEISSIDQSSNGLQVKYINKKLLFNDLKGVLDKVSVDHDKLKDISEFKSFNDINKIPSFERKLVSLYNAIATIRSQDENDDLSSLKALQQYQSTYEIVNTKFIKHFIKFIRGEFERLQFNDLNDLLIFKGLTLYIKEIGVIEFQELNHYFNQIYEKSLERYLNGKILKLKEPRISLPKFDEEEPEEEEEDDGEIPLRRRTVRKKKTTHGRKEHFESIRKQWSKTDNEIQDGTVVLEFIKDTISIITFMSNFINMFFHFYDSNHKFIDYMEKNEYEPNITNDLMNNLTVLFGNFINNFLKLNVSELIIPGILLQLEHFISETNEEFINYNFLSKISEKYKNQWNKFIQSQVDLINNSIIVANSGVLQNVKNVNYLLYHTETSIDNRDIRGLKIKNLIDKNYKLIGDSLINLFQREDPLLKNSDLDDKEREIRNVSILQNIFYTLQQVTDYSNNQQRLIDDLTKVFKKIESIYFEKQLHKTIGKLIEFINTYQSSKNLNKKYLKSLLTRYSQKDIQLKVSEIYKKIEKHFKLEDAIFEKDLIDKLWSDLELIFIDYFTKLNNILRTERDIDYQVRIGAISFINIHPNVLLSIIPPLSILGYFGNKIFHRWQYEINVKIIGTTAKSDEIVSIEPYDETSMKNVLDGIDNEFEYLKSKILPIVNSRIIDYISKNGTNEITKPLIVDSQFNINIFENDIENWITSSIKINGENHQFIKFSLPYYNDKNRSKRLGVMQVFLLKLKQEEYKIGIEINPLAWKTKKFYFTKI
ncbi:unnamed protein product [Candida verbasci]|uniref:Exocyst complex component Sec3 PIP2-binding N-terminal domain-containing protein n=1 Tax=Candida verbasci TaxID=1227364 RepID=A0A9W4TXY2_9ASCO|nr:unnamed protein product [Candida verbasci]